MIRIVVAGLVVAGLALGIWLLWPDGDAVGDTATTIAAAPETTTTTVSADPTTTPPEVSTTSTEGESHVVETVEKAEEILRELWFGWFEGIYNQDEERIREVVIQESQVQAGIDAFGSEFITQPQPTDITLTEVEILRSDDECLAVFAALDITAFRGPDALVEGVLVARRSEGRWKVLSNWIHRDDLWDADCDALL